jgi:hypothetical protein
MLKEWIEAYPTHVYSKDVQMSVTISLDDYPLLQTLPDPERILRSWIDVQYSALRAQHQSQPNVELIQSVKDACRTMTETTESVHEELEAIRSTQRNHNETVQKTLNQIPTLLAKSQTRGVLGETCLLEYLRSTFPGNDYLIESTASDARSGDIKISRRDFTCLLDAKFYTKTVPKAEVEKLQRDMIEKNIPTGVLVSHTSGVSGYTKTDFVLFKHEERPCCIIVLGNTKESPERLSLAILLLEVFFEKILKHETIKTQVDSRSGDIIRSIMSSVDSLSDLLTSLRTHEQQIKTSLRNLNDEIVKTIIRHQEVVRSHMNLL